MHADLLLTAKKLACANDDVEPSSADLRKAVSSAYYSVFHFISLQCAVSFIGEDNSDMERAWEHAYRTLAHRNVCHRCRDAKSESMGFPDQIRAFAAGFIDLYDKRCFADYCPTFEGDYDKIDTNAIIQDASYMMEQFSSASERDKRAFCAYLALKDNRKSMGN